MSDEMYFSLGSSVRRRDELMEVPKFKSKSKALQIIHIEMLDKMN